MYVCDLKYLGDLKYLYDCVAAVVLLRLQAYRVKSTPLQNGDDLVSIFQYRAHELQAQEHGRRYIEQAVLTEKGYQQ